MQRSSIAGLVAAALLATGVARAGESCDIATGRGLPAFPAPLLIEGHLAPPSVTKRWLQCLPTDGPVPVDAVALHTALETLVALDGLGRWFAGIVGEEGIRLCVDFGIVQGRGWFEPETRTLAVAAGLPREEIVLIVAHEFRHVDQWRRGFRHTTDVTAVEHVRQTYALEADASAFLAWVAWQSRESGDQAIWERALALENYGDIVKALGDAMDDGDGPQAALLAAFRAWYASPWRIDGYWKSACGNYLDLLDARHKAAGQAQHPPDRFAGLCVVEEVGDYGCADAPEISVAPHPPQP
jgi:hypothetical protein